MDWAGRHHKTIYDSLNTHLANYQKEVAIWSTANQPSAEPFTYKTKNTFKRLRVYFFKHYVANPLTGAEFIFDFNKTEVSGISCFICKANEFRNFEITDVNLLNSIKSSAEQTFRSATLDAFSRIRKNNNISNLEIIRNWP